LLHGSVLGLLTVLFAGLPSAAAAYYSYRASRNTVDVKQQLVTGNDKTVGEMLTEVHGKESEQTTPFDTHREPGT